MGVYVFKQKMEEGKISIFLLIRNELNDKSYLIKFGQYLAKSKFNFIKCNKTKKQQSYLNVFTNKN